MEKTEQILKEEISSLPPGAADDPFGFVTEVQQFLVRWCTAYAGKIPLGSPAYCCFIGCDRVGSIAVGVPGAVKRSLFREDTPQDLLGHFYISSFPLNSVFARPETFKNIADCEKVVESVDSASRPVVIFNAAEGRLLWRFNNTDDWRQAVVRPKTGITLASRDFDRELEQFHFEYTAAPQALVKPWANAKQLIPKANLEEEIRDILFIHLRGMFQEDFSVMREFHSSAGRTDLLIYFRSEKIVFYVELKVLAQYRAVSGKPKAVSPKESTDWGLSGIAQAYNYKKANRNTGTAYACCFDCRKIDAEIQELVDLATLRNVEYRRYFVHASPESLHASAMM